MTVSFLPDATTMLNYSIACLVLFITPGPDMSLFLAKTLTGGRKAGIAAMLGACTGCLLHTVLAALGLSVLIAASPTAFTILKITGAFYLLWLAYNAIRYNSTLNISSENTVQDSFKKTFLLGIGINLTNPKVVLFFITFLPLFVAADDPASSSKLFFLGCYFVAFCISLAILMILGAERFVKTLKTRPKIMRGIDFLFAGIFGAFALKILATQGR
jgi:threonine/homoserine/homoserine lactone efflux protein